MSITAAQCRAARALLGISQSDLAQRSGVGMRTIAGFESEKTTPMNANLAAIRRAIEDAGVVFLADGEAVSGGAGVRLKSG